MCNFNCSKCVYARYTFRYKMCNLHGYKCVSALYSSRYIRVMKKKEKQTLVQGMPLPTPPLVASDRLPVPRQLLPKLPSYTRPEHAYSLPDNTAGEAKQRKRRRGAAATATVVHADQLVGDEPIDRDMQSSASSYDFTFMEPPLPSSIITLPATIEDESLPRTTAWRKRRRHDLGLTTKNVRKNAHNFCGTCGQPKTKETGHSCLRGYVFCPVNQEGETLEAWRSRINLVIQDRKRLKLLRLEMREPE